MSDPELLPVPGGSRERFYPVDCVVAAIASAEDADAVTFELRKAGFSNDTSRVISGVDLLTRHQAFLDQRSIDERFAPKPYGMDQDIEDAYLAAARDGAHVAVVRAPAEELRGRVRRILIEHGGAQIRFYRQTGVEDL